MDVASVLTMLLLAFALAAQPWSVLASVLLVTAERGVAKDAAYVAGWTLALSVVAVITAAASPHVPATTATSSLLSWVEVLAGVALGAYAVVRSRRPVGPDSTPEPRWMQRLDSMSLPAAFALGAFLPNYVMVVAGVDELVQSGLTAWALVSAAAVFVLLSSLGVAAPLLVLAVRRQGASLIYGRWRLWLVAHGQAVLTLVLAVVALLLLAKGLAGVLG